MLVTYGRRRPVSAQRQDAVTRSPAGDANGAASNLYLIDGYRHSFSPRHADVDANHLLDGRLAAAGPARAQHYSSADPADEDRAGVFSFDTAARFFHTDLQR